MATVTELVTEFDFVGSIDPLTNYNDALGSSIGLLAGFAVAIEAAAAGFAMWAGSQLETVNSLNEVSRRTKIAVSDIQELSFAAEQLDGSSEALQSTLINLTGTIGEASLKGSEDFARLGISVRNSNGDLKTADVVLEDVRKRFEQMGLTLAQQESLAGSLGIDASLLQMLNATGDEMAKLRGRASELGTLTAEQADAATDYTRALKELNFGMSSIKQLIAVGVGPELTRLTSSFTDLIAENKDWIISAAGKMIEIGGVLLDAFNRLLPVIGLLTAGFALWTLATIPLATTLGVIFSPVVLITAAIVALLVIVDDLIVAFQGGESVIADFFQEFLGIDIVPIMQDMVDAVMWAIGLIKDNFGDIVDFMLFPFKTALALITGDFDGFFDLIFSQFEKLKSIGGAIASAFGFGDGDIEVDAAGTISPQAGSSSSQDNRQVNQQVTVNVTGSDAQQTATAVVDGLQSQLDNANTQLARGGM